MIGQKGWRASFWFLAPVLLLLALFALYPTIHMIYTSFTDLHLTRPHEQRFNFGRNYINLLHDGRFWLAVVRTLLFIAIAVPLSIVVGFLIAYLFNTLTWGRRVCRIIFLAPMVTAPSIAGLVFKFIFNYDFGMINQILVEVGLPRIDFLGSPTNAFLSVIIVDLWQWTPFATLVLLAGLESLPHEHFEAALIDGASTIQVLWHITLPMMKKYIFITTIFRFIQCIRIYDIIKLMTDGGPGTATELLNVYITKVGFSWFDLGYASALTFVALNLGAFLAMLLIRRTQTFTGGEGI
ncbi:MAG: sugar ABC transporter permease [Methanomassiliicoccales archaeon]|nr:sugar ABC transporter permease [Methanomassiliicoccales archaeon]